MAQERFCTGVFVGHRIALNDEISVHGEQTQLKWTLCFFPSREYPSAFGAGLFNDSSSVIHGTYNGRTQEISLLEIIHGIATYSYKCVIEVQRTSKIVRLHGTWNSLVNEQSSGGLAMICEPDIASEFISGIWVGQATPDVCLSDFCLPINPIRWCAALIRLKDQTWQFFGSGYFNDSADIENQPLLFYSLIGKGTLDRMKIVKRYCSVDYTVEYEGKLTANDHHTLTFLGTWSNTTAGSYGSFHADQWQLDVKHSYRTDLVVCEVCNRLIYPGDSRWRCSLCHFSTCPGCNLNSIAVNHHHPLKPSILSDQDEVTGRSCADLVLNSFLHYSYAHFLIYRHSQTGQLIRLNYEEMATYCSCLTRYWRPLIGPTDDYHRPVIMIIANTSPAYICCLLTGLLCQSVVLPLSGSLTKEVLKAMISLNNPQLLIVGEPYQTKIMELSAETTGRSMMIIYENEEQFQDRTDHPSNIVSFSTAIRLGRKIDNDYRIVSHLSAKTISAMLCTSGSTGNPKLALFTEELLIPNDSFSIISPFIRIDYQSFDPVLILSLMSTLRYGTTRGITDLKNVWHDLEIIRPTSLGFPPSIWNTLYKIFLSKNHPDAAEEIRQSLGGRVLVGTSGGGSISLTVLSFVRNQLKIDLNDMYGCRECGNISRNGIIYPGIQVRFLPVPEMNFNGINQGEICVHSPRMISGYQGIDCTASSFIDIEGKRYYRTGDIGILEGQTLKLIDRAGSMIKNSQGEWIGIVKIENILEQLEQISVAFVVGDSSSPYLAAIICPPSTHMNIAELDLLRIVRRYCILCGLTGPEIPQRLFIERDIVWNEHNGLMKEKKCRKALMNHYRKVRNTLFNETLPQIDRKNHSLSSDFLKMLRETMENITEDSIDDDTTISALGGNSLTISVLYQHFQQRGIYLTPSKIYDFPLKYLDQILEQPTLLQDSIVQDINWHFEWNLPECIKSLPISSRSSSKENILLTGATGFLGPIILNEILEQTKPNVIVYCLIRAQSKEQAETRLREDLIRSEREQTIDWRRIHCLAGNVAEQGFGLSPTDYQILIDEITCIYHNASWVHLELPYRALKPTNVIGSINCIELAYRSGARFVYVSSTSALSHGFSNYDSNGWVTVTDEEMRLKDGYGQTKVVVEKLLHQASTMGFEVVVVRPGTISADRTTGYTNVNDFVNMVFCAQMEMKAIVDHANMNFHWIPVDYCARAIVTLGLHQDSSGKCFNLYGNDLSISVVYDALFERFDRSSVHQISQHDWHDFVLNHLSASSRAYRIRTRIASMIFVSDHSSNERIGVPVDMTQNFLKNQCHLPWFEVTKEDVVKSIDYLLENNFLPVPTLTKHT